VSGSVAIGDVNGDDSLDLAVGHNVVNGFASVVLGRGDGGFLSPARLGVCSIPAAIATTDLNVDGRLDLAVVNSRTDDVSIFLNITPSRWPG
jgi:hypothetical protein